MTAAVPTYPVPNEAGGRAVSAIAETAHRLYSVVNISGTD